MPQVDRQFRPVPKIAPLSVSVTPPLPEPIVAEPVELPSQAKAIADGFTDDLGDEPIRVAPAPRRRSAQVKVAAVDGVTAAASSGPGASASSAAVLTSDRGSERNPFLDRFSLEKWNINPYRIAQDLDVVRKP